MRPIVIASSSALTELYASYLMTEGFDAVVEVMDGLQCMNVIRQQHPEVLILDERLPWGGASGVMAVLRQEFSWMPCSVILIGKAGCEQRMIAEQRWPVVACLQKPFRLDQLSDLLHRVTAVPARARTGTVLREMIVRNRQERLSEKMRAFSSVPEEILS